MWEVGCGRNPIVTRLALRNQLRITNEDELPQEQFLSDVGFSHVPHLTCPLTGRDKKKKVHPVIPGNAARILRKKYASSRKP
jgi:hypothetical protein